MHIVVLNGSSRVTDDQAHQMTAAVAHQARTDVWSAWGMRTPTVTFLAGPTPAVPASAYGIMIVDTIPDQPSGVLGFHTEDQGGRIWGVVACGPVLDAGMAVLTGDWSVASVLSHEVLELLIDPDCNLWANNGNGRAYSYEVCDPVEAPTYSVQGVSVSNFVTPAWFDPNAADTARYDHLGLLKAPFSLLPGGYLVWMDAGGEQQQFGDDFPAWRRAMKTSPYARTARRGRQKLS